VLPGSRRATAKTPDEDHEMGEGSEQLEQSRRLLLQQWSATRAVWNDRVAWDIERELLSELDRNLAMAAAELSRLEDAMDRAARWLGELDAQLR
jgi:hypothetical protein